MVINLSPPRKSPANRLSETIHGLTWADQQFLQQEIAKAERITQSEIILGIARRSSNYDFIALLIGVVIAFSLATVLLYMKIWPYSFVTLQLAQICLAVILQNLFVKTGWVIACVPKTHLHRAASRMAHDMFHDYDLQATHQRNALLIFVSLQERMIFLLPDKALRQKVPFQIWDELVQQALAEKGRDNLPHWLARTLNACTKVLHRYDPAANVNEDEISNAIRFV